MITYNLETIFYCGGDFVQCVVKYTNRIISVILSLVITALSMNFPMKSSGVDGVDETDLKDLADEVIVLVNEARAEEGLQPLYAVPYLCDMATVRARECISTFEHKRPDGSMFSEVIDDNLAPWIWSAENIACGMNTAELTFNQWKNSADHWKAIMNPDFTHIGVGVAYEPNDSRQWYWEQLFIEVDTDLCPSGELDGQYLPDKYKIVPKSAGDLNGDGVIDSFDYGLLRQYLAKKITFNPLQTDSADLFMDGAITYADAAYLKKYILGEIEELPVQILY